MNEWDNIEGFEQWSAKLGELLDAAREAALNPDIETRFAASRRLTGFIEYSWPNDQAIGALDKLAAKTAQNLMLETLDERLREISGRTAEWLLITKQMRDQTESAGQRAAEIRLEKAHRVSQSLTESVHLLQDLRGSLGSLDDPEFAKNVAKAVDTLQKLRIQIERVA
jgi:hypothetical protein